MNTFSLHLLLVGKSLCEYSVRMAIPAQSVELLREQYPDVPIAANYDDLADYLRMPLDQDRIEDFNLTQAKFGKLAVVSLCEDGRMMVDGDKIADLNRNTLTVFADLLRLPFGWYNGGSIGEARFALEEHLPDGRQLGSLKTLVNVAVRELTWISDRLQNTGILEYGLHETHRKVFMLQRGLQIELDGDFDFLVDPFEDIRPSGDRTRTQMGYSPAATSPRRDRLKSALPMYEEDFSAYHAVLQRRLNRIERTVDKAEITKLTIENGTNVTYGDEEIQLNNIERRIIDIVVAADGGITVQSVGHLLNRSGIGIHSQMIIKIVRDLQVRTKTDDRMPLLLLPTIKDDQLAIKLAPNVVVYDSRPTPKSYADNEPEADGACDVPSVDDTVRQSWVSLVTRLRSLIDIHNDSEFLAVREQLECYILDRDPTSEGVKPFVYPDRPTPMLVLAAMEVFKTLQLTNVKTLTSIEVRALSQEERELYDAEKKRQEDTHKAEDGRRELLAKFVYELDKMADYPNYASLGFYPVQFAVPTNCLGLGPDRFFVDRGASVNKAKQACTNCEAKQECLDYAIENSIDHGIWGGTTTRERRRIKKQRARDATTKATEVGEQRELVEAVD